MRRPLRVVDAGLQDGRLNIALDEAMLEEHQSGRIGDSLRFIHFPPTALVGRHQELGRELDLAYCESRGIGIGRRITGGGAIYLDPGQLGWALVVSRQAVGGGALADVARAICEAVADGLRRLGVDARYRPRNDIEVDGRKVSGTGGFFDGQTLIYQGTVLVDVDGDAMLGALRVPRAKLAKRGLDSAAQRIVTLRELLGEGTPAIAEVESALLEGFRERLGLDPHRDELSAGEWRLARERHAEEIGRDEFVRQLDAAPFDTLVGTHTSAGGTIRTYVRLEAGGTRLAQVLITGDFFVAPPRFVYDLEARLRGSDVAALDETLGNFITDHPVAALSVTADDFRQSIRAAIAAGESVSA